MGYQDGLLARRDVRRTPPHLGTYALVDDRWQAVTIRKFLAHRYLLGRVRIASVLLDESDKQLKQFDEATRVALSRGWPNTWTPLEEKEGERPAEAESLLTIYRALMASFQDRTDEAISGLRMVLATGAVAHLEARALQFLAQILYLQYQVEREIGNAQQAKVLEKDCRELCDRGFRDYAGYSWSRSLTYLLHVALGILDYGDGNAMSARVHLKLALEHHNQVKTECDRGVNHNVGMAHMTLGYVDQEQAHCEGAIAHYRAATRMLGGVYLASAYSFLSSALLNAGNARQAKKMAERGVKRCRDQSERSPCLDDLKVNLAAATISLGDTKTGRRLLEEVVTRGVHEEKRRQAGDWLVQLEQRSRGSG